MIFFGSLYFTMCSIYNLSCNQVFSSFGPVLKIAMFDKNGGVQALIQYPGELNYFDVLQTSLNYDQQFKI